MTNSDPWLAGTWGASWIWADGDETSTRAAGSRDRRQVILAVRDVELDEVPSTAPARWFADSEAVVYVNGVEVGRGPARGNPRRRGWMSVDISEHLLVGCNVIAIVAAHHGQPNAWWMPAPLATSGLRGGVVAFEAQVGELGVVATDETWLAKVLDGWSTSTPVGAVSRRSLERIDLRHGCDVAEPARDRDESWRPARVRSGRTLGDGDNHGPPSFPFGPTHASPLAPNEPFDHDLERSGDVWLLDRVRVGTLRIEVDGTAGDVIRLRTAERLDDDGCVQPFDEEIGCDLVATDGPVTVETLDLYGLRALSVDVPASIRSITLRERIHPVTGGHVFRSSDPELDRIVEIGRRTVSICSLDSYVDCPTREQRAWTGDSVVHQMVDLTTNDDWSLATHHPAMAASPRPDGMLPMAVAGDLEYDDTTVIPDWALHWIHSVANLERYVGDLDQLARLLPVAEGVIDWFFDFVDPDLGLPVDVYGWVIVDWASVPTHGASAPIAGLLGRALLDVMQIATALGDDGRVRRAYERRRELSVGFERFWDPERNRYTDQLIRDGSGWRHGPTASQHTHAAAVVSGFAPGDRLDRIVDLITDDANLVHATYSVPDGPAEPGSDSPLAGSYLFTGYPEPWWDVDSQIVRAQPFFRYVVHDALADAGRSDLVSRQLLDWTWLLDRCPTSLSECWFGGTTSHGWSATPTRDVVQRVLGVMPDSTGFGSVRIAPALGHLDWAEGTVPTPSGPLSIRVERTPGGNEAMFDSPVPVSIDGRTLDAGRHEVRLDVR